MFGPSIFSKMKRARWNLVACLLAQAALNLWQEVDLKADLIGRMHIVESRNRMLQFGIDRSLCLHYSFNPPFPCHGKDEPSKEFRYGLCEIVKDEGRNNRQGR